MFVRSRIAAGLLALGVGFLPSAGPVRADDEYPFPTLIHRPKHVRSTVATPHTMHQAGHPQECSMMAAPSYNEHYTGGYVGGGKASGGHGRCLSEGTWGWDYTPFRPSHTFLSWSHGRHYQGGTRGYATDGPKPLEHLKESIHERFSHE